MAEVPEKKSTEPAKSYADPFSAFRAEMDKMFHNFFPASGFPVGFPFGGSGASGLVVPSADVKESDHTVTISAELPGLAEDDVDVTVRNGMLTIKGEKSEEKKEDKENYHLTERRYGEFQRSFKIPDGVDESKIKAAFEKGVLTITMPKSKDGGSQERKIKIG